MLHVPVSCAGVHMCTKYTGRGERGSGLVRVFFLVTGSRMPTRPRSSQPFRLCACSLAWKLLLLANLAVYVKLNGEY